MKYPSLLVPNFGKKFSYFKFSLWNMFILFFYQTDIKATQNQVTCDILQETNALLSLTVMGPNLCRNRMLRQSATYGTRYRVRKIVHNTTRTISILEHCKRQ